MSKFLTGVRVCKIPSEEEFEEQFKKDKLYAKTVAENIHNAIKEKKEAKGTYKGVLYDLIDALDLACTTQDEHDKEVYKRIRSYVISKMNEVDE